MRSPSHEPAATTRWPASNEPSEVVTVTPSAVTRTPVTTTPERNSTPAARASDT